MVNVTLVHPSKLLHQIKSNVRTKSARMIKVMINTIWQKMEVAYVTMKTTKWKVIVNALMTWCLNVITSTEVIIKLTYWNLIKSLQKMQLNTWKILMEMCNYLNLVDITFMMSKHQIPLWDILTLQQAIQLIQKVLKV